MGSCLVFSMNIIFDSHPKVSLPYQHHCSPARSLIPGLSSIPPVLLIPHLARVLHVPVYLDTLTEGWQDTHPPG